MEQSKVNNAYVDELVETFIIGLSDDCESYVTHVIAALIHPAKQSYLCICFHVIYSLLRKQICDKDKKELK